MSMMSMVSGERLGTLSFFMPHHCGWLAAVAVALLYCHGVGVYH